MDSVLRGTLFVNQGYAFQELSAAGSTSPDAVPNAADVGSAVNVFTPVPAPDHDYCYQVCSIKVFDKVGYHSPPSFLGGGGAVLGL